MLVCGQAARGLATKEPGKGMDARKGRYLDTMMPPATLRGAVRLGHSLKVSVILWIQPNTYLKHITRKW
jgi:hypothetical protein